MNTDTYEIPVASYGAPDDALEGALRFNPRSDRGCLHELYEAAARDWPDEVAIEVPPGPSRPERLLVTYAELAHRAAAIANGLRQVVTDECVVAIMLPRDSD